MLRVDWVPVGQGGRSRWFPRGVEEWSVALRVGQRFASGDRSQNQQVKDFQYQLEISKTVSSVIEATGNQEELKHKLDEYIEEIDRCINFLSQEL